ncbi:hypothetical protein PRIPAC_83693 [Pristionchus pacificus]|uniref:Uncharacterized protein n=1 Tax=Pristionchus pacificus TaxID=54126 RepID=A0A2A6BK82_PRIPA|nr:hypothetical protein PRIPAC_83693 [Pristionchus pacificus]|eukprot:PDM66309.1 hypothetical protein PRIPAC_47726 [Pristionchus pacificus]
MLSLSSGFLSRMAIDAQIDKLFRQTLILSKLFTKSWGRPTTLKELYLFKKECTSQRLMGDFVDEFRPNVIVKKERRSNGVYCGEFRTVSPHSLRFPAHYPAPVDQCPFTVVMPERGADRVCIHLAGTGDHSYWRREYGLATPLLEQRTASIIVPNPFYGERRPDGQYRSSLHNVSDLFVMGVSLISECLFILNWAKERYGFKHAAISGVSMGGFMASLATSNIPYAVGCVPLLSAVSAGPSYCRGVLREAIPWDVLERELRDRDYVRRLEEIPGCDWIHRAHENAARNNESLARSMMDILMTEFTHLYTYPTPVYPQATVALTARSDGYIMHDGLPMQDELWKGSEMRYIERGHVTSYVFCQNIFRECINRSFEKLEQR